MHLRELKGAKVASAGIDYLTFTMKPNNPGLDDMISRFVQLMTEAEMGGDPIKESGLQGYQGYLTTHLFSGERQDGFLFRASSDIAHQVALEVIHGGREVQVTRIDYQATIITQRPLRGLTRALQSISRKAKRRGARQDKTTFCHIESPHSGDSLAIGSRRSTRYLRIYDKTAQQGGRIVGNQYRFEIELKKLQARREWQRTCGAADIPHLAMSVVAGSLLSHGLPVPWLETVEPLGLPSTYDPTTEERRLKWLLDTVAPVVKKIDDPEKRLRVAVAFGLAGQ